ncbi:MAG: DUF1573 domain-containing protein [Paludibacteraceae bacterium]|nr:DUF1573 domain-containing protein [Bacteroidaceae bacterium]MBR5824891.1 DUF1573 domain-containing protein [Paludibacteraceae bacterium]
MVQALNRILGLCVCLFFASCEESEKERLSRLVKEWEGKEILFPAHSTFTIQGKDTVDFDFKNATYKIVTYIDSVGCTSCKLQLHRWKELVKEVDSLTNGNVPFLFYFHPKDMKELRYLTRRDGFAYPVSFDEKDDFNRLNHFPSEMMFQTFLLDKENRVIALGNPVQNPNVKGLYLNLIKGNGKTVSNEKLTTAFINSKVMDFGSFPKSEKQERSFVLTNTGDNLLVIQDIVTSCGCTKVEYSKEPVRPGGTLGVKVIYEAEKTGHFNKTVTVYCNVENSPLRLTVKGDAK